MNHQIGYTCIEKSGTFESIVRRFRRQSPLRTNHRAIQVASKKALLLVALSIGVLTLKYVLVSRQSISASFSELEPSQCQVEYERGIQLLNQQPAGLSATLMDYAYWSDKAKVAQSARSSYFKDYFATDNLEYHGISRVLVLDSVGPPLASAELTAVPALVLFRTRWCKPCADSPCRTCLMSAVRRLSSRLGRMPKAWFAINLELLIMTPAPYRRSSKSSLAGIFQGQDPILHCLKKRSTGRGPQGDLPRLAVCNVHNCTVDAQRHQQVAVSYPHPELSLDIFADSGKGNLRGGYERHLENIGVESTR